MPPIHQQNIKRRRGRPRKPRPPVVPLAHSVSEYCARTGESPANVWRKMTEGRLKYVQDGPGRRRRILTSEYVRQGYITSLSELVVELEAG